MSQEPGSLGPGARHVLDRDEVQNVLSGAFYTPHTDASSSKSKQYAKPGKPDHYKVICISMYIHDLDRLDQMVEELKSRGMTKASRSALIRYALSKVDLDEVPRGI